MEPLALHTVLLQQVPDALVLEERDALNPFHISPDGLAVLPEMLAWSQEHNMLFCIERTQVLDNDRLNELRAWSRMATCHMAYITVCANCKEVVARMDQLAFGIHVWFIDQPERSVFLSNSPEASDQYRMFRLSATD